MKSSPIVCLETLLALFFSSLILPTKAYDPTWESLDARPLPQWYDDAKFGIFIHWGVFSVPAFETEWFWYVWKGGYDGPPKDSFQKFVEESEVKNFGYQDYAHRFTAQLWDPDDWAQTFSRSGAQYVVLTSKHHEGFRNWDSRNLPHTWNWNAMDVGPKRDLVGDLAKAVKKTTSKHTLEKLHFGLYHSLFEWYNPLFMEDFNNNFTTKNFAQQQSIPELYDIVKKYEPEVIWSDGYSKGQDDYWQATEFLAWYATNSTVNQTGVWNDRWGRDVMCKHGSFRTCRDGYRPKNISGFKFENCKTIDKSSWGYNRKARYDAYEKTVDLIHLLIETVAFNGNLLLNVGPRADGTMPPIFVDRLVGMGEWLEVNGEAIYKSKPWSVCQNETAVNVFYTTKGKTLYALMRQWPKDNILKLECPIPTDETKARMLGVPSTLGFERVSSSQGQEVSQSEQSARLLRETTGAPGLEVTLPPLNPATMPCQHAWVVALTGILNV